MDNLNVRKRRRGVQNSEEAYAGPSDLTTTPPMSPPKRVRRDRGVSDEENQRRRLSFDTSNLHSRGSSVHTPPSENSLEEITGSEFRVGGPEICRLPLIDFPLQKDERAQVEWESGGLRQFVASVLRRLKIDHEATILSRRSWVWEEQNAMAETIAIVVLAKNHEQKSDWYRACYEIRSRVTAIGLDSLNIDIGTLAGFKAAKSYLVEKDAKICQVWENLKSGIKEILGSTDWLAIDLLRRGISPIPTENPITIAITVSEESPKDDWNMERDALVGLLEKTNLPEVAIAIARGSIRTASTHDRQILPPDSYQQESMVGRSVGSARYTKESGTLGGFLELVFSDATTRLVACTCYHCVLPDSIRHPSLEEWQQNGVFPGDIQNTIRIYQPSAIDLAETKGFLETEIGSEDSLEHAELRIQAEDPNGFLIPFQRRKYEAVEKRISTLRALLSQNQAYDSEAESFLGTIYSASGKQRKQFAERNSTCDWALVDVIPSRQSHNYLPSVENVERKFTEKNGYLPADEVVTGPAPISDDIDVFKWGRTTQLTRGRYRGSERSEIKSWTRDSDGNKVETAGPESVIVGMGYGTIFSRGGDSGAFVVDRFGSLVGLTWAGNDNTGVTYVMQVDDLFEDIKSMTGAIEVRLPTLQQE